MKIELDRKDLESLIKGSYPPYHKFGNTLVVKAGHHYSDAYSKTSWDSLSTLTEEELYELYMICKNN